MATARRHLPRQSARGGTRDAAKVTSLHLLSFGISVAPIALVDLNGVSVLLVEDDPDSGELFSHILTSCGASVRVATSARRALVACDEHPPQVIVSDLAMPEHDGFDLLRALRTREHCRRVPVLAVTGHAPLRARALEAGFCDFLTKPVPPSVLCERVARHATA